MDRLPANVCQSQLCRSPTGIAAEATIRTVLTIYDISLPRLSCTNAVTIANA